jgi:hypothetical protein
MTDRKRDIIEKNLAESRRLGKEADKAADRAVKGLRRAARSGAYRTADTSGGSYVSHTPGSSRTVA